MKIFMIVGEASGDLQASLLAERLKSLDPSIQMVGWGGDKMKKAGVKIRKHISELDYMGFVEVIKHLPEIRKNFNTCKAQIHEEEPNLILFVDYPGFNLRMTKWCKSQGYKTCYYISPQVWAWKENRVQKIKAFVDKLICILPFEPSFYEKYDMDVDYVGHPLTEVVADARANSSPTGASYLSLLPGSRKQEIASNLPLMLKSARGLDADHLIAIAKSPTLPVEFYTPFLENYPEVQVYEEGTYSLLIDSAAAMVTSGTATLETALFGVPQMVCYRAGAVSVALARYFIKVKYISLVNLIMDEVVVKEMIQKDFDLKNTIPELGLLLDKEGVYRRQMIEKYQSLHDKLTQEDPPSLLAAQLVMSMI